MPPRFLHVERFAQAGRWLNMLSDRWRKVTMIEQDGRRWTIRLREGLALP